MSQWEWSGIVGIVGGSLVFFAVLIPVLLVQMRRYGRLSFPRILGAAAISIYGVALFAYTILPLPQSRDNCAVETGSHFQPIPFHFVIDIADQAAKTSWASALTGWVTMQVLLNVVLFLPLGVLVRKAFNLNVGWTVLIGFGVSLLIETTQGTANWGLYACPYRVADADDLLANTFGAFLGALLSPRLVGWIPNSVALEATRLQPRRVTAWRRWAGMALDAVIINVAISFGALCVTLVVFAVDALAGHQLEVDTQLSRIAGLAAGALVIVLPALRGTGASWGERIVYLAPVWPGRGDGGKPGRGTVGRRVWRACTVALPYLLLVGLSGDGANAPLWWDLALLAVSAYAFIIVTIAVVSVPFTRNHRGLSFVLAGADIVDSRTLTIARARD